MNLILRIPVLVVAMLALLSPLDAGPPAPEDLVGSTWELVSHKYGDATEWENAPGTERKIKMITATHFIWVSYDRESGKIQDTGGGTYTLAGATYTELVEFANVDNNLRNQKQVFTLDLKGDRLEQTGQLSTGFKIAEVWQRVR